METKEFLINLISENGVFSKEFKDFEVRPQQIQFLEAVYNSFEEKKHLTVEASTGIGKGLGYLLPALYKSKTDKILISTNTKALQDQLYNKDIPEILRILKLDDIQVTLAKGKSNYLCKKKVYSYLDNVSIFDAHEIDLVSHLDIDSCVTGEQDEFKDIDYKLWEKVCVNDVCLHKRCQFFEQCFYYKARKKWWTSNIIICNHYLFACDLAIRLAKEEFEGEVVLPKTKYLIVDEAHNFEDTLIKTTTQFCSMKGIAKFLSTLYSTRSKKGLLPILSSNIGNIHLSISTDKFDTKIQELIEIVERKSKSIGYNFNDLFEYTEKRYSKFRLKLQTISEIQYSEIFANRINLIYIDLLSIVEKYDYILSNIRIQSYEKIKSDIIVTIHKNLKIISNSLHSALSIVYSFVKFDELTETDIYWVENIKDNIKLNITPLNISELLKNFLYPNYSSIIYTSATLSTGGSFNYFFSKLGLDNGNQNGILLDSPFDYENNSKIFIPTIESEPNSAKFSKEIGQYIQQICVFLEGRTFVLFTSFKMLNEIYDSIKTPLQKEGITVLSQAKQSKNKMLSEFCSEGKYVLLGVSTFWEGIDVRGAKLSCVIMPKLPFQVPNDPIVEAKIEKINKEKRNSFMEFMLPEAAIKFKQGFGRLIRSNDDKGIAVFFDNRLYKKSYGRYLLRSLPPSPISNTSFENCFTEIKSFLVINP